MVYFLLKAIPKRNFIPQMLEEISITNLGVIQSARLPFGRGLTVITGETGAGKTMVLNALALLLGKRSDSSVVRHGSEFTSVEGCWNVANLPVLPQILETGAVVEDDLLYLNRTVYKDGKSRAVIGGKTTPASVLAAIGDGLVSIHGQSDQIRLKSAPAQREALDSFAGNLLAVKLEEYQAAYHNWVTLTAQLKDIKTNMVARRLEYESLTGAVAEIEKVNPKAGEDDSLKAEVNLLANTENLSEAAQVALSALSGEDSEMDILSVLSFVAKTLSAVSDLDPQVQVIHESAEALKDSVNNLSFALTSYVESIDTDVIVRLNELQERISAINGLVRKYGANLDEVLEYWKVSALRLIDLDPEASDLGSLEKGLEASEVKLEALAASVSKIRESKKVELEKAVNAELAGLAMAGNKLQIHVTRTSGYTKNGVDEISFMLLTPGTTEPRPIGKSSSGGEKSRIMLALEVVLAGTKSTPTYFFDEVDSGIGGSVGVEIGKRLARLSKNAQVIVVTHLPQVAAFSDNHLRVLKTNGESFVSTDVRQLTESEKVDELARMLSGLSDSDSGKVHAAELIGVATAFKSN